MSGGLGRRSPPGEGGSRSSAVSQIERERLIAILRLADGQQAAAVIDALAAGGVRIVELTMTVPGALAAVEELAKRLGDRVLLGVGTVLDADTANRAIDAGARFIVSPVCRPELVETCHRRDVVMMPGCFTPTEILAAWDAGADFVKVFPARSLAPSFIKDVHEPLPQVKLIPTGGISSDNVGEWLRAGVSAVGVGGALLDKAAIAAGRLEVVTAAAERLVRTMGPAAFDEAQARKAGHHV